MTNTLTNTEKQKNLQELEEYIKKYPDADKLCKQICLWLIKESNWFTKPICLGIIGENITGIALGIHNMNSEGINKGRKTINNLMNFTNFRFSAGTQTDRRIVKIWLAPGQYGFNTEGEKITEIECIRGNIANVITKICAIKID